MVMTSENKKTVSNPQQVNNFIKTIRPILGWTITDKMSNYNRY